MDRSRTVEPRPLRQIDDTIPRELERICQRALAKRASERYSTGQDLAEDLRHFLQRRAAGAVGGLRHGQPAAGFDAGGDAVADHARAVGLGRAQIKIVPKGLRSFDRHDAEFFLELLPGRATGTVCPRACGSGRRRIESTDLDATFSRRPDLRPIGLWQVVAGQGGPAAAAGQRRAAGLHRGDA